MLLLAADHRHFSIPPSTSVPLLTSGIPPACKGLPPLVCQADSLQPNQLMEQLCMKLFNCSSSSDTTSAAQLTFMRHFVSELIVPVKCRQQFSMGKRRKGSAKASFSLGCSINRGLTNLFCSQWNVCQADHRNFTMSITCLQALDQEHQGYMEVCPTETITRF